jgi:hypothetical protein
LGTGRIHEFCRFCNYAHPFQMIRGAKTIMIANQYAVRTIPRVVLDPAQARAGRVGRLALGGGHFSGRVTGFDYLACLTSDYRFAMGAGLPKFASSIGMFVFISFSTIESRPSSHT